MMGKTQRAVGKLFPLALLHWEDAARIFRLEGPSGVRLKLKDLHQAREVADQLAQPLHTVKRRVRHTLPGGVVEVGETLVGLRDQLIVPDRPGLVDRFLQIFGWGGYNLLGMQATQAEIISAFLILIGIAVMIYFSKRYKSYIDKEMIH